MIYNSKVIFSRWFQDETDVPNNKRMFPCLFVMRSVFLFLWPSGVKAFVCGTGIEGGMRFWVHRCSHKLWSLQM